MANDKGRPKVPFDPFEEEVWRRLTSGEALPHLEKEATYLSSWAKDKGILQQNGAPLGPAIIRERIKKRFKGTAGYKDAREHHLALLRSDKSAIN